MTPALVTYLSDEAGILIEAIAPEGACCLDWLEQAPDPDWPDVRARDLADARAFLAQGLPKLCQECATVGLKAGHFNIDDVADTLGVEGEMSRFLLAIMLLVGCEHQPGGWSPIKPPPGAAPGTRCWVYGGGAAQDAWGGPRCEAPQPKPVTACGEVAP